MFGLLHHVLLALAGQIILSVVDVGELALRLIVTTWLSDTNSLVVIKDNLLLDILVSVGHVNDLSVRAEVVEVNKGLGRLNGLPLLPSNHQHTQ